MPAKIRLDRALVAANLAANRSQAENYIKLGQVLVNGIPAKKSGDFVRVSDEIKLNTIESYVSRAGYKLSSVADNLKLDFRKRVVLDVGSSTGGFTDYALQRGASRVLAVDVGTNQLHSSLRSDERIELHEKTDIRDFCYPEKIDLILIDVSFISVRNILPHIFTNLSNRKTQVVVMLKPQFEAGREQVNKGIIKNESIRRQIIKDFENWVKKYAVIVDKRDSLVEGSKGNRERFYLLTLKRS